MICRALRQGAALAALLALGGCLHMPAPNYQPGISNLASLSDGTAKIAVDAFIAAEGVENHRFILRGNSMTGAGPDGTFSHLLQQALESELRNAGRFAADAGLRVSGTLTENRLSSTGSGATISSRFVVTRDGTVVYDAVQTATHDWDASFMAALAVPASMQGYVATVQQLVGQLFRDPAFSVATR